MPAQPEPQPADPAPAPAGKAARGGAWRRGLAGVAIVTLLLLAGLAAAVVFGPSTPAGQRVLEQRLTGLRILQLGNLVVEGISGDVWSRLNVRRIALRDSKGVWIEVTNAQMDWEAAALLKRQFHARSITADRVEVFRRPVLSARRPAQPNPVSTRIDQIRTRVITREQASVRPGDFDIGLNIAVPRGRGPVALSGRLDSRLHRGDFAQVKLTSGPDFLIQGGAAIQESQGGALAGLLGLPVDRPLHARGNVDGLKRQGKFALTVRSGTNPVISGQGVWNQKTIQARGQVQLGSSSLTRTFAEQLGAQVRFDLTGHRADERHFSIIAAADADNIAVRLGGLVDPQARTPGKGGLKLKLAIVNLNQIVPAARVRGFDADGILKGTLDDWTFAGTAIGRQIEQAPLSFGEVAGPVEIAMSRERTIIKADLQTRDGSQATDLGRILGTAPTIKVQIERLKDGRVLLQNLDVQGRDARASASGTVGLLGALDLKGELEVSDLARWRPGARGRIFGGWSARQGGNRAPWQFSGDLKSSGFVSALPEFDRLMGLSPALKCKGQLRDGRLDFESLNLSGQQADVNGKGTYGFDGKLGFDLDWRAKGPFAIGPIQLVGNAEGNGRLDGTLDAPRAQFNSRFDQLDVPNLPMQQAQVSLILVGGNRGFDGSFGLAAQTEHGPGRAASRFSFVSNGLALDGLQVNLGGIEAFGQASLVRGQPSRADLTVTAGPGLLLAEGLANGRLVLSDSAAGPVVNLEASLTNARPRAINVGVNQGRLVANGPLSAIRFDFSGNGIVPQGNWTAELNGNASIKAGDTRLLIRGGGRLGKVEMAIVETAQLRLSDAGTLIEADLKSGSGQARLNGNFSKTGGKADLAFSGLDLRLVNQDLAGTVEGVASLSGQGARLDGQLRARLSQARTRGAPLEQGLSGQLDARLRDQQIELTANLGNGLGLTSALNLNLPTEASAAPLRLAINRTRPINGTFSADGQIRPLWDLLVGRDRTLEGIVSAQGKISGTLGDPRATGEMTLSQGRYGDGSLGLDLQAVELAARLETTTINLERATATDGRNGRISGQGRISLARAGESDLRIEALRFRLIDNDVARIIATGQTRLNRGADGQVKLTGALNIDRADIAANPPTPSGVVPMAVVEINRPQVVGLTAARSRNASRLAVGLDVALKANRGVFVKGRGLDLEMSLDAHVGGTSAAPRLSGRTRVVRGDYDFSGKRFSFDPRSTVDLASSPEAIRLDLTAVRDDPSLTATVRISGTAARPRIDLSSSPSLPTDEILSQVLFGASAAQLSPLEAAQLASAVSALASGGGFDVIGGLRNLAGLDRLAFAGGGASDLTIAGGKYLSEDVYLELIGGGRDGPTAQVEWRVRRTVSLVSRLSSQGGSKLSVRWRRDY